MGKREEEGKLNTVSIESMTTELAAAITAQPPIDPTITVEAYDMHEFALTTAAATEAISMAESAANMLIMHGLVNRDLSTEGVMGDKLEEFWKWFQSVVKSIQEGITALYKSITTWVNKVLRGTIATKQNGQDKDITTHACDKYIEENADAVKRMYSSLKGTTKSSLTIYATSSVRMINDCEEYGKACLDFTKRVVAREKLDLDEINIPFGEITKQYAGITLTNVDGKSKASQGDVANNYRKPFKSDASNGPSKPWKSISKLVENIFNRSTKATKSIESVIKAVNKMGDEAVKKKVMPDDTRETLTTVVSNLNKCIRYMNTINAYAGGAVTTYATFRDAVVKSKGKPFGKKD